MVREPLPWRWLLGLALAFTLLDCFKPLHIDDAAYYYFARQAAEHPTDPYGFQIFWWEVPQPANHVLAPPVLPYWWSLAIRLFGDAPVLWKLWLFPLSLLFVVALHLLGRRLARGLERPLVVFVVFSPALLPSLNLMLDIPALALTLGAVMLFLHAVDRGSFILAAAAGLMAGVGMETKYTAFLAPAIMGLYAAVHPRWLLWKTSSTAEGFAVLLGRLALWGLAALIAAGVFVGWETFVHFRYGESHFLHALHENGPSSPLDKLTNFSLPLLTLLGGVAWPLAVLGLASLRCPRVYLRITPLVALAGYGMVASLDEGWRDAWHELPGVQQVREWSGYFEPEDFIYGVQGMALVVVLGMVLCRVGRASSWISRRRVGWRAGRVEWFLILWFLLEVAGYYALTPFPGVRRIFGPFVVGTLLVGRLASRTCRNAEGRRFVWGITAFGGVLGLAFAALDFYEAATIRQAAETGAVLAQRHASPERPPTIWYLGHWEFQFYAEQAGMKPIVSWADRSNPAVQPIWFEEGDLIVLPTTNLSQGGIHAQIYARDPDFTTLVDQAVWEDTIPLRSVIYFYGGPWPLGQCTGPRREITVWRVTHAHQASP